MAPVFLSLAIAFWGFLLVQDNLHALPIWDAISAGYALCVVLGTATGAVMLAGGLWTAATRGRRHFPVRLAFWSAMIAGATIGIGTITSVIPCSGSS